MKEYILVQAQQHPCMEPQDAVKMCYQATFGAEHLLVNKEAVLKYFHEEFEKVAPAKEPLFEDICKEYSRVNLAAWKEKGLPPQWIFQMFFLTASEGSCGTEKLLDSYLEAVGELAIEGQLPFDSAQWEKYSREYKENGRHPVHHSDSYRKKEKPAYRIVHKSYVRLIPILSALWEKLTQEKAAVIAIDGPAASGKSTLAADLSKVLEAGLIHMDDFFLPPAMRTKERLLAPGGNIHYERFAEEVLPYLKEKQEFTYIRFDCSNGKMEEERKVRESAFRVAEGSYSCHPVFEEYMDLRVFCDVDKETQMERILLRDGKEMAAVFQERWIPMEEKYFETFKIKEKAFVLIDD